MAYISRTYRPGTGLWAYSYVCPSILFLLFLFFPFPILGFARVLYARPRIHLYVSMCPSQTQCLPASICDVRTTDHARHNLPQCDVRTTDHAWHNLPQYVMSELQTTHTQPASICDVRTTDHAHTTCLNMWCQNYRPRTHNLPQYVMSELQTTLGTTCLNMWCQNYRPRSAQPASICDVRTTDHTRPWHNLPQYVMSELQTTHNTTGLNMWCQNYRPRSTQPASICDVRTTDHAQHRLKYTSPLLSGSNVSRWNTFTATCLCQIHAYQNIYNVLSTWTVSYKYEWK